MEKTKIYLIIEATGQYEDYRTSVLGFKYDKNAAQAVCDELESKIPTNPYDETRQYQVDDAIGEWQEIEDELSMQSDRDNPYYDENSTPHITDTAAYMEFSDRRYEKILEQKYAWFEEHYPGLTNKEELERYEEWCTNYDDPSYYVEEAEEL